MTDSLTNVFTDLLTDGSIAAGTSPQSPRSVYLHIPFCRRRCYYCDFPITVVGDKPPIAPIFGLDSGDRTGDQSVDQSGDRKPADRKPVDRINGSNSNTIAHYVEVLCQEIRTAKASSPQATLDTVSFGGGTPSLLSVPQLDQILATLDQQFGISAEAEISMEVDPGTFDLTQLQGYRSAGVNRVSLGVQAFQPELLSACGRSHTVEEAYAAVAQVQQAGFANFSLDLISGLPHQTLADWQDSLDQAIALSPTHLSCYDLTIEPITPFGRQYKPGMTPLPSDETTAQMYRTAQQTLTAAGYSHYEISNYAQPGFQSRHNRVYWENRPFYGFGMGATSYVAGDRHARPRTTREYYEWVATLGRDRAALPPPELQSPADRLLETLMLGLRLAEGISVARLRQQFGSDPVERVWRCLVPHVQQGWVSGTIAPCGWIRLTDPEGFLFSNQVLADLFEEFEEFESGLMG